MVIMNSVITKTFSPKWTVHYKNHPGFNEPRLYLQRTNSAGHELFVITEFNRWYKELNLKKNVGGREIKNGLKITVLSNMFCQICFVELFLSNKFCRICTVLSNKFCPTCFVEQVLSNMYCQTCFVELVLSNMFCRSRKKLMRKKDFGVVHRPEQNFTSARPSL